jgi:hypothetical protein
MCNRSRVLVSLFLSVLLLGFAASAVAADNDDHHVGVRAGVSGDPGQFYIGAHMDLKEVTKRVWFRPNLEVGVGDGLTLISLNGEFVYFWKGQQNRHWMPYGGLGPAFVIQAFSAGNGESGVGPGLNFVVGIQERKGLIVEMKIGAFDSPGFKAGIGWTW